MLSDNDFEKLYRPSATVIFAAFDPVKGDDADYKILLAKRTVITAFALDHHVFPGGVFDAEADEDPQWLKHFHNFGVTAKRLNQVCLQHLPNRPKPIMTNGKHISRDISLRITAIREIFEEVGVLFCLNREQCVERHKGSATYRCNFDRVYWQEKVHNNSKEFINLCRHLAVIPDIWSLQEWSIWRSPLTSIKKYDTVLYIVTLEEKPTLLLEPSEVERALWIAPAFALDQFRKRKIWLPPLLYYEIFRLTRTLSWSQLKVFAFKRSSIGCTLLMMAYYRCNDTLVGTLPYDDDYPINPLKHTGTIDSQKSLIEFEAKAKNLHRLICRDMYDVSIACNIPVLDGHVFPKTFLKAAVNMSKL